MQRTSIELQVEVVAKIDARLAARHQIRRRDPHDRRPVALGQSPLLGQVRPRRIAVEHHDRGAQQQRAHQRVPHHPRGGGEPLQALAGREIPAEALVLVVLHELAAVAVDDRLGQAGRPGGEEHVQRMVERDRLELQRAPRSSAGQTSRSRRAPRPRHRAPRRRARGWSAGRGSPRPPPSGSRSGRGSRSHRRPAAPWARSGRSGR